MTRKNNKLWLVTSHGLFLSKWAMLGQNKMQSGPDFMLQVKNLVICDEKYFIRPSTPLATLATGLRPEAFVSLLVPHKQLILPTGGQMFISNWIPPLFRWFSCSFRNGPPIPTHFFVILTSCKNSSLPMRQCDGPLDAVSFILPHRPDRLETCHVCN